MSASAPNFKPPVPGVLCLPPGEPQAAVLPRGACDCHVHVLGPFGRYPLAASRPYDPPAVPLSELQRMMQVVGLERVVIAHVSAHGLDQSVTLDALAALGSAARGVAMLGPQVSDGELRDLHAGGMRGVRLSMAYGSDTPLDAHHLRLWAERIAPLGGWHIAMWPSEPAQLALLAQLADTLPVDLVLDHLASHAWYADGRVDETGLALLDQLLQTGKVWLKLSGMYRAGAGAAPWPALVEPMARLARRHTARMLWASDWPYVGLQDPAQRPTTLQLLGWLDTLGLDAAQREQILVHNPQRLYGFEPVTR